MHTTTEKPYYETEEPLNSKAIEELLRELNVFKTQIALLDTTKQPTETEGRHLDTLRKIYQRGVLAITKEADNALQKANTELAAAQTRLSETQEKAPEEKRAPLEEPILQYIVDMIALEIEQIRNNLKKLNTDNQAKKQ